MNGFIADLSLSWPFSAYDNDFAVFMYVFAGCFAGIGVLMAVVVGNRLDGPIRTLHNTASSSSLTSWSSVAITPLRTSLVVGRLPQGPELWMVAWLKGGRRRLEDSLYVAAAQQGWVKGLEAIADVEPADPLLADFKLALQRTAHTERDPVHATGAELARRMEQQAVEAGLARSITQRSMLTLLAMSASSVVLVMQVLRTQMDGGGAVVSLFFMSFIMISPWAVSLLAAGVGVALFAHQHRQAQAYLRWLDSVLVAARDDVVAGVAERDADVILVAAFDGPRGLGATGKRLGVEAALSPKSSVL